MKKNKTKSILACAVLASVLGAGTASPASPWAAVCPFGGCGGGGTDAGFWFME